MVIELDRVRPIGRPAVEVLFDDETSVPDDEQAVYRAVVAPADSADELRKP
ncbi:MAG TPA: hypothetical protein VHJ77_10140 [Vicinamibacterales bacterium]|nr:hypothetical protein [Vicinamibacterales bacterium]